MEKYLDQYLPVIAAFAVKVVVCLLAYLAGKRVIAWLVRMLRRILERSRVQQGAVTFAVSMAKIFLYMLLVLGIAAQFGVQESSVAALVASGGVAVGLALQGGLSNLAGGFLILLFQPFQIGDYIITQGQEGVVDKIEILYTTLLTVDNRRAIIPNGSLANNVIVNVTAQDRRKLEIKVGISYEDSIADAKAVLQKLLESSAYVMPEEETQVFVAELGESSVVIGLRCWVKTGDYLQALWQLNEQIKAGFDRAGIHIPYPCVTVYEGQKAHGQM